MKLNHIETHISYHSSYEAYLKVARSEPSRTAVFSERLIAIHSTSKAGYVTTKAPCQKGEQFL